MKQGCPVVNPDSIRQAIHGKPFDPEHENIVWWTARMMVRALFHAGHNTVIVDATNIMKAQRKQWLDMGYKTHAVVFATRWSVCHERAELTNKPYLHEVIDRMCNNYEPVNIVDERFVEVHDGLCDNCRVS